MALPKLKQMYSLGTRIEMINAELSSKYQYYSCAGVNKCTASAAIDGNMNTVSVTGTKFCFQRTG